MNVISKIRHGSHLYGLNTENSDKDYKGIFLPTFEEMVTMTASHEIRHSTGSEHAKNIADDVDTVYYSLQKFIKMACDGETIALDYLHCNDENLLETSPVWAAIVARRRMFYTMNMKAFLGYCRKQASKYGVKGTRLRAMEDVLNVLRDIVVDNPDERMDADPATETLLRNVANDHLGRVEVKDGFYKGEKFVDKKILEVCDAKYDFTTKVSYVVDALQKKYDAYGHRAQAAKNNEGVDWKAISHALRAGYQLKEIYETGDLKYPLKDREFLLSVKQGKLDFTTEVAPRLEEVIEEVEVLAEQSGLKEKVDRNYWDQFIVDVYNGVYDVDKS
mgnify:CR=1 FL=1